MKEFIVETAQRLKEFTDNHYAQASFFWNYLIKNREIRVNGLRINKDVNLSVGDSVCYYLTKKQEEKAAFYTVYKDENIWVVDKESGVNSEAVFCALSNEQECYFIHRLDRNTKGLLVFALNERTEKALLDSFRERAVEKVYAALCFGKPKKQTDYLVAYLKKDAEKGLVSIFDRAVKGAEEIRTEYCVEEEINEEITKLSITLHTGKTHQIRAHLAHIGTPVVGDMKYGDSDLNKKYKVSRQCLVSKYLRFSMEKEWAYLNDKEFVSRFEAELPKE